MIRDFRGYLYFNNKSIHYSIMNNGIITQIELNKEFIPHYIKAYNNKRLDESRKIRAMICEDLSHREGPL
jgi:hypothetical protein